MRTTPHILAFVAAAFCTTSLVSTAAHAQAAPAAAASQDGDSLPAPRLVAARQAEIPFELFRGNRVYVDVMINGHRTPAILDTGASATVLDREFARKIGIGEGRKVQGEGAGGSVEAEVVGGIALAIAGMRFEDVNVGVLDLAPVARQIGRPMPVIIGRDFFNASVVEFDWENKRLMIAPSSGYRPSPKATMLAIERRGPFNFVKVAVAGLPEIDALLDLGNGGALKLPSDYWEKQPVLADLRYAESQGGGVGGMRSTRIVTFPKVRFAGVEFADVPGSLGGDSQGNQPQFGANLGIGFLKQFHLALDLGNDRLFVVPRANKVAFERDRSGLRLGQDGDGLKVLFASPQGPGAAAGLKQGDRVVAINGKPIETNFFASADWAWNNADAGTPVSLSLQDGRVIRFLLADYY